MECLAREIGSEDQVIVVGDGRQLGARGCCPPGDERFEYHEFPGGRRGNPGRDFAIERARGDFLMFIDDDDLYIEGAIQKVVRPALAESFTRPHIFRCAGIALQAPPYEWTTPGAVFAWPNLPNQLGHWDADGETTERTFIETSLAKIPAGPILHDMAIYAIRPHTSMGQYHLKMENLHG